MRSAVAGRLTVAFGSVRTVSRSCGSPSPGLPAGQAFKAELAGDAVLDVRHDPGVRAGIQLSIEESQQVAVGRTLSHAEIPTGEPRPRILNPRQRVFHTGYWPRRANLTRSFPNRLFFLI